MGKIVFLVEEPSMEVMLRGFLPKLFPDWVERVDWQCVAHEGKSALEKSIPVKLRAWREPGVRFVVLRDKGSADCYDVKQRLQALCEKGRRLDTLVRIPCRELESWYLGDLAAVEQAFDLHSLAKHRNSAKFRDPDSLGNPVQELRRLAPMYGKVSGSRAIGPLLATHGNRSHSFGVFVDGLRDFVDEP